MKTLFFICVFTVLLNILSQYSCQVTHLYGTVRPRVTGLLGYVTLDPTAATTFPSVEQQETTTGLYSNYHYDTTSRDQGYDYNRGNAWDTYQTTTQAPEDYDAYARRYSSSSSSGQSPYQSASSYSSASGQGVRAGGLAASSSSSQSGQPSYGSSSSYGSASGSYGQPSQSAYDSQYGQQAPQQPSYDSRYSPPQQPYGQAYDSRYSQPSQSGRYDQYGTSTSQDSRYDQYGRPVDPRNNVAYRQPATPAVDYSLYPPTLKSIVLSESSVFLFWVDPALQGKKDAENNTKYIIKYSSVRPTTDGRSEEETEVTGKSHQINQLQPGADYSFSIKANRNGQETGWSAPANNRTLEAMPTGAPSNVKAQATDRDATIKISPPEGFSGNIRSYLILYAPSGGGQEPRVWSEQTVPAAYSGETTFILGNLKPAEEYFYTIQATNSRGSSPFTEIASFKTLAYPNYDSGSSSGYNTPPPYRPYGGDTNSGYTAGYNPGYDSRYGQDQYGRPEVETTTEDYWSRYPTEQPRASENTPDQWGNYPEEYQTTTTEDYWSRYPTAAPVDDRNYDSRYQTAYPGYDSNTPDYYGRYAGQQTTQDYWAARYPTTTPSSEDPYGQTGLIGTVTASPQTTDIYWSPYWGAATEPQRAVTNSPLGSGSAGGRHSATPGGPEPPSDVRVDSLEDPTEALVTFTPSVSSGISNYEIYYSYDPYATDDLWQIETAPGDENQLILVRLTPNTPVYIKVRAKSATGTSEFSQMVPFQSSSGQAAEAAGSSALTGNNRQEGETSHDPYANQRGTEDQTSGDNPDEDPTDAGDEDPDAAHTRNSRT